MQMPEFLTPDEVAAMLRVDVRTLANWRSAGTGPRFTKVGRLVRYARSDISDYLMRQVMGA